MRIKKGGGQTRRAFAWILALAMVMTNLLSGWTPVMASAGAVLNVTLTVIGDTGNHIDAPDSHTGFVYWLKDEPMQVTLGENNYVAENCKDLIPEILRKNGITSDVGNSDTLYPYSMEKGGVVLDGNFPGWSVIVANADGTFDSNGWGSYPNAAQLSEGCRLIYYWTDAMDDCRVTIDGSNTQLNYDTDAVTDVSFYTETDPDATVSELKCEAGSQVNLKTKLAVPEGSMVSRELNWTSTNENAAKVEPTEGGALITGVGAGETDITASMTNTLGDEISATCHVTVSASGTVYTGLAFQEGTEVSLKPEESKQLTPVFTPEVPKEETAPVLTWNSTNQEVVTVSDGLLEAVAPGTADVTAEFVNNQGTKVQAACKVTVEEIPLTGLSLNRSQISTKVGSTEELSVILNPENATEIPELQWSVDKEGIVSVQPNGQKATITALGGGKAVVTVKAGKFETTCNIEVQGETYKPLTSLSFKEGTSTSMKKGERKTLTPKYDRELAVGEQAPEFSWSSNKKEVAAVDASTGEITAVAAGTADITAEFTNTAGQKVSASFEVNVTDEAVKLLKNIKFFKDSKGATPFDVVKELDPATGEMTVGVPENTNMVSVLTELEEHANATIQVSYKNYDKTKDLTSTLKNGVIKEFRGTERMLQSDQEARDVTVTVTSGDTVETYTVHLVRKSLVKSLVVQDDTGKEVKLTPKFNSSKLEYEVTVPDTIASVQLIFAPNNEASKELKVNGQVAEGGVYTLDLAGSKTEAILTAGNEAVIPTEYKLSVKKLTSVKLQFHVSPEDAVVAVYDTDGRVWSKDGVYSLLPGTEYSYNVTKTGYVGQSGKLTLDTDKTLEVQLEKAPESTLPNYDAEWGGFRKDENNQGITQADTPTSKEDVSEKWAVKVGDGFGSGAVSSPILVNGNLYCFAGDSILKVDKETGTVLRSGKMATSSFFAINPPCYANGMILVGIAGQIQAFNADTLESLWIYKDSLGGQTNCTIRYSDGYLYTGFWNAENRKANFVCLSATDEDPSNSLEQKTATWKQGVMGGFYWAGAYTTGDVVMVGTDDGDRGNTSDTSYVYVMNKYTGEVLQKVGPHHGDIRSDISYSNGRIYFTSKGGYLYSYALGSDGRIEEGSRKELQLGSMSTGTPAIVGNRLYVAHTDGSNFSGTYYIDVIKVNHDTGAMELVYKVQTEGYVQTSGSVSVQSGYNYVYFFDNSAKGNLYMVKDNESMTQPDPESGILYIPSHEQYCIASPIIGNDGTIYFKNDSGYMFAVSNKNPGPKLTETLISDRTSTGASLKVNVSQKGTLYYVVRALEQPAPSYEEMLKGTQAAVKTGENTVALTELTADAAKVYVMVQNASGKSSAIASAEIPASKILGDMNGDGKVTYVDCVILSDKLLNGEEVLPVLGDMNGDGKVSYVDCVILSDELLEGNK